MALEFELPSAKRTRTSSSKVRTGCVTCKVRHVKCDEEKPNCRRCVSTGRKCDGYELPRPTKAAMRNTVVFYVGPQQIQRKLLPVPKCSELDHYHRYVAPKISANFDSPFWTTLIGQMAESEPAIRHAVSAITNIHRDMEKAPIPLPGRPISNNTAALKETGEAMRSLSKRIEADPASSLVPLVACLLFTCLECMRGNVDGAITHMMSGFSILNAARAERRHGGKPSNMNQSDLDLIEEHLVPFFGRLSLLCVTFGRPTPAISDIYDMAAVFASLDVARHRLYELAYCVVSFIRQASPKAEAGVVDIADIIEQTKLQRQCAHWSNKMEEYLETSSKSFTSAQRTVADLCRIHARTITIWLAVSLEYDECALDAHTEAFESVVDLGERIISTYEEAGQAGQPSKFSFEMGVIPPLYYCALKCRVKHIRRQAIILLHRAPRREGLWNAHVAAKVAEAVVKLEEGGTKADDGLPAQNARIHGAGPASAQIPIRLVRSGDLLSPTIPFEQRRNLPLEEEQIMDAHILRDESGTKIEVVFRAKPWGMKSDWAKWSQEVQL